MADSNIGESSHQKTEEAKVDRSEIQKCFESEDGLYIICNFTYSKNGKPSYSKSGKWRKFLKKKRRA